VRPFDCAPRPEYAAHISQERSSQKRSFQERSSQERSSQERSVHIGDIAGAIGRQIQSNQPATFISHLWRWPGIPLEFICADAHIGITHDGRFGWKIWDVSRALTRSCPRGCEGECGCGECLAERNGESSGQLSARSALYARSRSEMAGETPSSLRKGRP